MLAMLAMLALLALYLSRWLDKKITRRDLPFDLCFCRVFESIARPKPDASQQIRSPSQME